MASRLRSVSRPVAAAFLRSASARSPAASLPRVLAPTPRPSSLGRQVALARSLQPLHSAISAARLTSRLGGRGGPGSVAGYALQLLPGSLSLIGS